MTALLENDLARSTDEDTAPTGQRYARTKLRGAQLAVLLAFLAAWEFLPKIDWLSERARFLDSFFISSPTSVAGTLWDFFTASNGRPSIWPYLTDTVGSALVGTFIGTALGAVAGLALSNSTWTYQLLRPFIVAVNAIPRIAIIPIFVIIIGPNSTTSVVTAVTVVFFVVFFNALEGGRSVPGEVIHNARLLGANKRQVMFQVRWPYVLAWTVTALPNAISFGLLIVVTAEVMTGGAGIGRLLVDSVTTLQPALTFAVVVTLSVVGITLVTITEMARQRLLHWWAPDA